MFRVGQKVVCVEGWQQEPGCGYGDEIGPIQGDVYTIRNISVGLTPAHPDSLDVRLFEIRNPERNYAMNPAYEPAFRASRFRPLVERKTDISIFNKMLKPTDQKVNA